MKAENLKQNMLILKLPLWLLRVSAISAASIAIFLGIAGYKIVPNEACAQCVELIPPLSGSLGSFGDFCPGGGLCNPRPDTGTFRSGGTCNESERGQSRRFTAQVAQDYGNYVTSEGLYWCACGWNNSGTTECGWVGIHFVPQD